MHESHSSPVPRPAGHRLAAEVRTCVRISVAECALRDAWLMHCGVCEMSLILAVFGFSLYKCMCVCMCMYMCTCMCMCMYVCMYIYV